jgi:hypothetical protein
VTPPTLCVCVSSSGSSCDLTFRLATTRLTIKKRRTDKSFWDNQKVVFFHQQHLMLLSDYKTGLPPLFRSLAVRCCTASSYGPQVSLYSGRQYDLNYRSSLLLTSIRISGHYNSISHVFRPMWQNDRPQKKNRGERILVQTLFMRNGRNVVVVGQFYFSFFYQWIYFVVIFLVEAQTFNYKKISGECLDRKRLDLTWL